MQQMAQMQSLLESMSPEAQRQLDEALSSVLDPETQRELAQLASLMERLMPMDEMRRQYPFLGDESLTLDQAMQLMGNLQDMDELERVLQEAMRTGKLDDIDPDQLAELLGEEARRTWEQLQRLIEILKEGGYIKDTDKQSLPPGRSGESVRRASKRVFINMKRDRLGNHELDTREQGRICSPIPSPTNSEIPSSLIFKQQ